MNRRLITVGVVTVVSGLALDITAPWALGCGGGKGSLNKMQNQQAMTGKSGGMATGMANGCMTGRSGGTANGGMGHGGMANGAYPGLPNPNLFQNPYVAQAYAQAMANANDYAMQQLNQTPAASATPSASLSNPLGSGERGGSSLSVAPSTPAEPANRMLYVTLTLTGVKNSRDGEKLESELNQLKEVRAVTVKRDKYEGTTTVKVWYSERNPVKVETLVAKSGKLGFNAVLTDAN